jgi:leader peptidase (prepilin peptidase)/N-methyltransferase
MPDAPVGAFLLHLSARLALGLALVALALIDLDYMILPDSLTLSGAALGGIMAQFHFLDLTLVESLVGAAFGYLLVWVPFIFVHEKLMGFPGMGHGDAKLMLVAGAWFGWMGVLFTLFAASIQGSLLHLLSGLFGLRLREPTVITEEREALKAEIAAATGEERERLQHELDSDPALRDIPKGSYGHHRISFGPFLALSLLELLLFATPIKNALFSFIGLL